MVRSPLYKTAFILFALLSLFTVVAFIPALLGGPDNQGAAAGIPQVVIILASLTGVAGLFAAYGAWRVRNGVSGWRSSSAPSMP